jgi:hypothetical protein
MLAASMSLCEVPHQCSATVLGDQAAAAAAAVTAIGRAAAVADGRNALYLAAMALQGRELPGGVTCQI